MPLDKATLPARGPVARAQLAQPEDELQPETTKEKCQHLGQRLRADIRFLYHSMSEFADLPPEIAKDRGWRHCVVSMEAEVKELSGAVAADESATSLDAIVELLNYRDRIVCALCSSVLFQKALMDLELKVQRQEPSGMEEFDQQVQRFLAKHGTLPETYRLTELVAAGQPGPFTFDKVKAGEQPGIAAAVHGNDAASENSDLQAKLLTTLRQMLTLERGIRHLKFGEKVTIPDKSRHMGRAVGTDELRKEITKWFNRCARLEHELQQRKAQRHTPWEVQVEFLKAKCAEKDQLLMEYKGHLHKLESDVSNFKVEYGNLRREKAELAEKNQKMVNENLPLLDRMDTQRAKALEAVDRLTADAEMLSSMLKRQLEESRRIAAGRDEKGRELARILKQLKRERSTNRAQDDELQKKATLYLRTVEAREATHKTYMQQKERIKDVEERERRCEEDWKAKMREVEVRDKTIARLKQELRRANQEIDELEQQKKMCMEEFKSITGRPYSMLLEQFRIPTEAAAPAG